MENTSAIRSVHRAVRPLAGRKRGTAKPVKERTAGMHRNGFLNHAFQPVWGVAFNDWQKAEQEFFISVENLCRLYGWTKPDVSGLSFPENIREAYNKVTEQQTRNFDLQVKIGQDKQHACCMTTLKSFDTGYHLFYIPVRPVWKMRDIEAERPRYQLFIVLFAYLYQVAGVPFFNEPGTVDSNYDTIKNWLEEVDGDEDEEDVIYRNQQVNELKILEQAGKILQSEIQKQFQLKDLERLCLKYQNTGGADKYLTELVTEFIKLIKDYPKRALRESMYYEDEPEDNNTIYWEQYISFYWSGEDRLAKMLFRMINDEFQEMGYQEEPVTMQWFDRPQEKPCHVFDFEPRILSLIDRLSEILNDYDYEEPNE
ncbi:hypothetical protein PQ469_03345 [Mucilaginibacter sp. KACC 22773]|uniref:hypothetical protein n=1 Tax=Mucilaginibacter sp. KACC 22773 TaxID=3025671 RepID=UPI002366F9DC|nr:hypothetical protein [Mucilaginibacter sp. KACC 22773]WDF79040.1 hypothetical protein PQ469_03345 [Mucilaginibacter sp. KACC 22773]